MSDSPIKTRRLSVVSIKLLEDHEHIRSLLNQIQGSLQDICHHQASESLQKAQENIRKLVEIMNIHAACEEQAVFPALSKYHPMPIMEAEHDEILLKRAAIMTGIIKYSFPEDCTDTLYNQYADFIDLLHRHLAKEENAIFPLVEQSLSPEEKSRVADQMEKIIAKSKASPVLEGQHSFKAYSLFHLPDESLFSEKVQSKLLLQEKHLQVKVIELKKDSSLAEHWSQSQAILLLNSGEAEWSTPENIILMRSGDGILMSPLLSHSVSAKTDCRFLLILFS